MYMRTVHDAVRRRTDRGLQCGTGIFTVDNSSMPSMFSGSLDDVVKNSFDRFRFGGTAPTSQKVLYLNLQEIKGIRFGTRNPISYFDNFYNAELF